MPQEIQPAHDFAAVAQSDQLSISLCEREAEEGLGMVGPWMKVELHLYPFGSGGQVEPGEYLGLM